MEEPCPHCGRTATLAHKGQVEIARDREEIDGYGTRDTVTAVTVSVCGACHKPSVWTYDWADDDEFGSNYARLYPTARDNTAVPAKVAKRLSAANAVKDADPSFYAVGIRRVLETVVNDQGGNGKDLFAKLFDLADRGLIPKPLADAGHQIRMLGNLGAHDVETEVMADDIPALEDLTDAILEYLYRAPAKVAVVRASLENRKAPTVTAETADGTSGL